VREALGERGFILLALGFFVCGVQVVFIGVHLPTYLRDQGTAGFHRRHWRGLGRELLPAALVAPAALAALLASWPGGSALAAAALALVPAVAVPHWLGRRLGGHSGDSYGACVEWSEALGLLLMGLVARAAA
jgi:adenosylcobinamide-GDP ribazoletransferase